MSSGCNRKKSPLINSIFFKPNLWVFSFKYRANPPSISTEITCFTLSARKNVKAPRPGPISSTVLFFLNSEYWSIRNAKSLFISKFCPNLVFRESDCSRRVLVIKEGEKIFFPSSMFAYIDILSRIFDSSSLSIRSMGLICANSTAVLVNFEVAIQILRIAFIFLI
ncbi:hypothetical protein ES703_67867 [subsurface metagenome]